MEYAAASISASLACPVALEGALAISLRCKAVSAESSPLRSSRIRRVRASLSSWALTCCSSLSSLADRSCSAAKMVPDDSSSGLRRWLSEHKVDHSSSKAFSCCVRANWSRCASSRIALSSASAAIFSKWIEKRTEEQDWRYLRSILTKDQIMGDWSRINGCKAFRDRAWALHCIVCLKPSEWAPHRLVVQRREGEG